MNLNSLDKDKSEKPPTILTAVFVIIFVIVIFSSIFAKQNKQNDVIIIPTPTEDICVEQGQEGKIVFCDVNK